MVALLRWLKPEMNGAVTGDMEARGVRYGLNYGVAVPVIRKAAAKYAPDHALAGYLFRQDIRELKLAAVYVDDPKEVTMQQMEKWASAMPADEIMEHAAMNLFYAAPEAGETIVSWLGDDDRLRWKGALQMMGRRAVKGIAGEEEGVEYLNRVGVFLRDKENPPVRAAVYALSKLAGISPGLRSEVLKLIRSASGNGTRARQDILEETATLLEYSK